MDRKTLRHSPKSLKMDRDNTLPKIVITQESKKMDTYFAEIQKKPKVWVFIIRK